MLLPFLFSHTEVVENSVQYLVACSLPKNRKDYSTARALTKLVGKRRALLDYLKDRDIERYRAIVKALGLRK